MPGRRRCCHRRRPASTFRIAYPASPARDVSIQMVLISVYWSCAQILAYREDKADDDALRRVRDWFMAQSGVPAAV